MITIFDAHKICKGTELLLILLLLFLFSCSKNDDFGEQTPEDGIYSNGKGVFVVNEGNFGNGNGSLSFLNLDSLKIYNDIFYRSNQRPLGDVPISMTITGENAFLVVNNSSKIEVVKLQDMSSLSTISGLTSPRYIYQVSGQKAYVSDFVDPKISIVNTQDFSVTGKIDIGCASDQMLQADGKIFSAFWSNYNFQHRVNNKLMVIDTSNDLLVDSVLVGKEPNSMVRDKDGKLWVLCSGGFASEENPSLWQIDPESLEIVFSFIFPDVNSSPTSLCRNGAGDSLYYLNQGIYQFAIDATVLPNDPLIEENEHLFYSLAIDPETSIIYATDAIDYQQRGLLLRYRSDGTFIDSFRAGIIPGGMVFNF